MKNDPRTILASGLEGVIAAETRLSAVNGEAGKFIIAGFPVEELTDRATFEETLYLLWKQGVSTVIWLTIRDAAPNPSYGTTIQAGPFRRDGRPKPAARAFRFPFVAERLSRSRVRVWGRAPAGGPLVVERRSGSRWVTVARLRPGARKTFTRTLRLRSRTRLRARVGEQTSLTWTQR